MNKGLDALTALKHCVTDTHFNTRDFVDIALDVEKTSNIIEKELKALEIIKEKQIDCEGFMVYAKNRNVDEYNDDILGIETIRWLTQEEYDLLKEVLS